MKLNKDIEIIDLAILLRNNLIIADTHIGYEEVLNKQGILIPRFHFRELMKRLEVIISMIPKKPERIIINGDIKHEFGTISSQEWRQTLLLVDFLSKCCKELVLINGNHDTILGPIADKKNIRIVESLIVRESLIIHGHILPKAVGKNIKRIIIAHEHPAVSINDGSRSEKFKCFLKGKWKGKELIVQPSCNLVAEGTDILKEAPISPFLKQDLKDFKVFVIADKVYEFGKVEDIS